MVMYGEKVMEVAESKELIKNPRHPYTRLLLAATPGSQRDANFTDHSNEPPNLAIERKGCPFAFRCPLATDICREEMPTLESKGQGDHIVACHHAE